MNRIQVNFKPNELDDLLGVIDQFLEDREEYIKHALDDEAEDYHRAVKERIDPLYTRLRNARESV